MGVTIAAEELCHLKGVPTSVCREILVATNLLGKPLKSFIVNPADLTSGKRVNHSSRAKMYKLCKVLKPIITAMLTDMSGPKNSQNVAYMIMWYN
jgi:hypothetical protein